MSFWVLFELSGQRTNRLTDRQVQNITPAKLWQKVISKGEYRRAAAATDAVEIADGDLMPVAIAQPNAGRRERGNAGDVGAEREWELDVIVNDLQRHEVVPLVVSPVVEQHAVMLCRREAATDTYVFVRRHQITLSYKCNTFITNKSVFTVLC